MQRAPDCLQHHVPCLRLSSCLRTRVAAILYKLKRGEKRKTEAVTTIPTLDFNVETCKYGKKTFSIWVSTPCAYAAAAAPRNTQHCARIVAIV